jgi:putative flippase GtrA
MVNWCTRFWLGQSLSFQLAVPFAYLVGMTVAYLLNRVFVFPSSSRAISSQAIEFFLVNVGFLPVVWASAIFFRWVLISLGMTMFVDGIAHALALAVPMFATFLIYKFKTFRIE